MNPIANVLDLELNSDGSIIEIGITEVNLASGAPVHPEIVELTGITDRMLHRSGEEFDDVCQRIKTKYGGKNRMLITDNKDELIPFVTQVEKYAYVDSQFVDMDDADRIPFHFTPVNVSDLYRIAFRRTGLRDVSLEQMILDTGNKFEGRQHRAGPDSFNIAKLFCTLMGYMRRVPDSSIGDELT